MSKVSIVVPVYNAEPYLDNCIQSLVNQTFSDIEIVLVNDGSKDKSGDVIDKWRKKDARVVCVNQENQGVTRARKNGANAASGEWVTFVDADDELPSNALELMLNDSDDYDIIIGYFERKVNNKKCKLLKNLHWWHSAHTRHYTISIIIIPIIIFFNPTFKCITFFCWIRNCRCTIF